jgi:hypothetical protein
MDDPTHVTRPTHLYSFEAHAMTQTLLKGCINPIAPAISRSLQECRLALADKPYRYPAEKQLSTEGLSVCFAWESGGNLGTTVVILPGAHKEYSIATLNRLQVVADLLAFRLATRGELGPQYKFESGSLAIHQ